MAHAYNSYIYEGENVLWDGVVSRVVLFFFAAVYGTILRLLYSWAGGLSTLTDENISPESVHFFVGLLFFVIGLLFAVRFFGLYLKRFVVTDKRVLIISGIIGVDVTALVFTQIKNASLDVGLTGMLFGVGDVLIDSGKIYSRRVGKQMSTETKFDTFNYVASPKEVYAYIQQGLIKHI